MIEAKDIPALARQKAIAAYDDAWSNTEDVNLAMEAALAAALNAWPKGYISEGAGKTEFIILPLPPMTNSKSVIEEIAAERQRQIEQEGWTPAHDNQHDAGEMADAAACYAMTTEIRNLTALGMPLRLLVWPSSWSGWWKPKDRRRDLIRAAALIVAEIERLDRVKDITNG
jgi:hypothetical protein